MCEIGWRLSASGRRSASGSARSAHRALRPWPRWRWCLVAAGLLCVTSQRTRAEDYFWLRTSGGDFHESTAWQPCDFLNNRCFGPGGASDTVNFDLSVIPRNRYTVENVQGENAQLLVHTDSVLLRLTGLYELHGASASAPGLVAGVASGDSGNVTLMEDPSLFLNYSLRTEVASIGHAAGSGGSVRVDGVRWLNNGDMWVGRDGTGAITIRPDSIVGNPGAKEGVLYLGYSGSGDGRVTVEGGELGDSFANWGAITVGRLGEGTLRLRLGGTARADFVYLGFGSNSTGTLRVQDEDSELTAQRVYVGGSATLAGGVGEMTIESGGEVDVQTFGSFSQDDGAVRIWDQGTLILEGGTLRTKQVRKDGTFIWNSGTLITRNLIVAPPSKFLFPPPLVGEELILTTERRLLVNYEGEGFLSVFNGGRISLEGGLLLTRELDIDDGVFDFTSGVLNLLAMDLIIDQEGVLGADRTLSGQSVLIVGFAGFTPPLPSLSPIRGREVRIGDEGAGTLRVMNGAEAYVGDVYIGYASGSNGSLLVDGAGSRWVSEHAFDGTTTVIGRGGIGSMIVSNGAVVEETDDEPNPLIIGELLGAEGLLTLTDPGSQWHPSDMTVGNFGNADLFIRNGAVISTEGLMVAIEPESRVAIEVDGADSLFDVSQMTDPLSLGRRGVLTLDVTNGATLLTDTVVVADGSSSHVSVTVDGAESMWQNDSQLDVGFGGDVSLSISNGGQVSDAFANVAVNPLSEATVTVTGDGSAWRHSSLLVLGGTVDGTGGQATVSVVDGGLVSAETVRVLAPGTLSGDGIVQADVRNMGLTAPGDPIGVLHIDGDFTQEDGGTLAMQIRGTMPGEQHDQLTVTGTATLAGTVQVELLDGYLPAAGAIFTLVQATAVDGGFDSVDRGGLPTELFWHPVIDEGGGTLSLKACARAGDVDRNCAVTLADSAAFVSCLAGPGLVPAPSEPLTSAECLAAFDFDHDGDVDLSDHALLQTEFRREQ